MIDIDVIEDEIRELEAHGDTTYKLCERLAWLYVVRDHMLSKKSNETITPMLRGSEFMELASGISYPEFMQVMDEHMETMKLLYPKGYDAVIDRLVQLHKNIV